MKYDLHMMRIWRLKVVGQKLVNCRRVSPGIVTFDAVSSTAFIPKRLDMNDSGN